MATSSKYVTSTYPLEELTLLLSLVSAPSEAGLTDYTPNNSPKKAKGPSVRVMKHSLECVAYTADGIKVLLVTTDWFSVMLARYIL